MSAIDADPNVLAACAAASAHAYRQGITHVNEEIKARDPDNLDALVGTLADEGPYAYTIVPEVHEDGSVRLPILTTRQEISEAYAFIRGISELHEVVGVTEVRGAWYLFQDAITRGRITGTEPFNTNETLGLFPSGAGEGITGELVWLRKPRAVLGRAEDPEIVGDDDAHARRLVHERFTRYLDSLRGGDVDGILENLHDFVASAIRDQVGETGTLVELTGEPAHRTWYEELFSKYDIRSAEPLCQITEDWYVFSELRIEATKRDSGEPVAWNTAEFHVPAKDGRFIARIGHGTEPTPIAPR